MRHALTCLCLAAATLSAADPGFPRFEAEEIAADLTIGYAVKLADLDGDGRLDIVIADKHRVVWHQNPTWKRRTILTGVTKPDNVCLAALDLDGGGDLELVLGAGWNPSDTATPGTLHWLKRGKSLDEEWTAHAIPCDEPTIHRVVAADVLGDERPEVVVAPLFGRGSTAKGNHLDGRPVRVIAYPIPADPVKGPWRPVVLNDSLHVVHNLTLADGSLYTASYEGVSRFPKSVAVPWRAADESRPGDQSNPAGSRGSSEVAVAGPRVAAVEPWHGNQVVVYEGDAKRLVLDDRLRWGHAVKFLDDTANVIVAGVRDDPKKGDSFSDRRGVRLYRRTAAGTWERKVIEDGGVAVEDLAVGDLNGDGRPEIVAVGRATGNCRIYWNRGE